MGKKTINTFTATTKHMCGDYIVAKYAESIIGVGSMLSIDVYKDHTWDPLSVLIDWYAWDIHNDTKKKLASKKVVIDALHDTARLSLYSTDGLVIAEIITNRYYDKQWKLISKSEEQSGNCDIFNKYDVDKEWENIFDDGMIRINEEQESISNCSECEEEYPKAKDTGCRMQGHPRCTCNEEEPKNNDGKSACWWCGSPTKKVSTGFVREFDICTKCGR